MLHKTKGIVIKTFKYGDSSLIAKIFTQEYGLQSFFLPAIKSRKKNKQLALYQGMNILDLVIYQKEGKQLNHIKEAKLFTLFHAIPGDIVKTSILFFLNELLYHSLPEERNPILFNFVESQILQLEMTEKIDNSFHLYFMVEYAKYLGIIPLDNYSPDNSYFNVNTGKFYSNTKAGTLNHEQSLLIHKLLSNQKSESFKNDEKRILLSFFLDFYQIHVPNFPQLKSYKVLQTILN